MQTETAPDSPKVFQSFQEFGLSASALSGIADAGFLQPTPIQVHAIPPVLAGKDVIAQAKTGSGKTAAFLLPAISRLKFDKSVEVLVLCPTRELATQVADDAYTLGRSSDIKTVAVVGGQHIFRQVELINRGAQIVAATPGRLMDHMREGRLKNFKPHIIVLDEADEMLDMGFIDDIRSILKDLPSEGRQTLLFSATMPPEMRHLAKEFMNDPHHIKLIEDNATTDSVEERLYVVKREDKLDALIRLIDAENPEKFLVFCRTKADVDELSENLSSRGISVHALHGDIGQNQRFQTVNALSDGRIRCVIATDVAARGLDIPGLTHVINMNVPEDHQRYIHRIGRTGRGTAKGIAMTIGCPQELRSSRSFNASRRAEFLICAVPSRSDALKKLQLIFKSQVSAAESNPDYANLVTTLLSENSAEEVVAKLVSMMTSKKKVRGADQIGLCVDQAEKLFTRDRGGDRGSDRRGFDRRFGGNRRSSGSRPSFGSQQPRREFTPRPPRNGDAPRFNQDSRSAQGRQDKFRYVEGEQRKPRRDDGFSRRRPDHGSRGKDRPQRDAALV